MKKCICVGLSVLLIITALAGCTTTITPPSVPPDDATPAPVPIEPPQTIEPHQTGEPTPGPEPTTDPGPRVTPTGNSDFPDAGLPDEAIVFPDAQWNDMGYFNARAIAYVETEVDPEKLPDDWPAGNKFFNLFFQVECTELIEEYTNVSGVFFGFVGPGVHTITENIYHRGDIPSTWYPDVVGDVGYVFVLLTAEKLEDITQVWYKYFIIDEQTDDIAWYITYITSMPFGSLIVRERPTDFDYIIPPSAVLSVGDWSEPVTDPTVRVRTLAYDEYPMSDNEKRDILFPGERMFFFYFEAENTGSETLDDASIFTYITGTGVKRSIWTFSYPYNTVYRYCGIDKLEPGEKGIYITDIVAKSVSDVQSIIITMEGIEVPFAF